MAQSVELYRQWMPLGRDDVILAIAPLVHVTGMLAYLATALWVPATLVLTHRALAWLFAAMSRILDWLAGTAPAELWQRQRGTLGLLAVVLVALIGFLVVSHFLQVSPATNWDEMWLYKLNLSVTTYVTLLISSTGPIMYFAWLSFLLAYVAYSFPLILLGWREARYR